jgi:hypothetical protein
VLVEARDRAGVGQQDGGVEHEGRHGSSRRAWLLRPGPGHRGRAPAPSNAAARTGPPERPDGLPAAGQDARTLPTAWAPDTRCPSGERQEARSARSPAGRPRLVQQAHEATGHRLPRRPGRQPGGQQRLSLDVGADVRPPQRGGEEGQRLRDPVRGQQRPARQVRRRLVERAGAVVQQQRGVLTHPHERRGGPRHLLPRARRRTTGRGRRRARSGPDPSRAGPGRPGPRSAIPSASRFSGVPTSQIPRSGSPERRTALRHRSVWWPG